MGKTRVQLFLCDWFRGITSDVQKTIFENAGDHAGEMETAFGLAYFNDLVRKNDDGSIAADDGAVNPTRFEGVNNGWVSITRPWHLLTSNTGSGNPHPATAEKGEALMKVIVERLSAFLVDLARSPIDERFPF